LAVTLTLPRFRTAEPAAFVRMPSRPLTAAVALVGDGDSRTPLRFPRAAPLKMAQYFQVVTRRHTQATSTLVRVCSAIVPGTSGPVSYAWYRVSAASEARQHAAPDRNTQ
jgi:hypothetical protein